MRQPGNQGHGGRHEGHDPGAGEAVEFDDPVMQEPRQANHQQRGVDGIGEEVAPLRDPGETDERAKGECRPKSLAPPRDWRYRLMGF